MLSFFFMLSSLYVFICSCFHFLRCFYCWLHLFTLLFARYFDFVLLPQLLRIWESFFHSDVFYLTFLPDIWHNLLLLRLLWGQQFCLEGWRVDLLKSLTLIHCFLYFLIFSLLSLVGTSVRYLLLLISSKYPFTLQKGTKVPRIYTIAF